MVVLLDGLKSFSAVTQYMVIALLGGVGRESVCVKNKVNITRSKISLDMLFNVFGLTFVLIVLLVC